jgi:7-cyano-7-deazaguanine reductase
LFFDGVVPLEEAINSGKLPALETFPSPFDTISENRGVIRIIFPEFTCVCPKTGYPDFASIGLWYLPDRLCIELKSWKLYLNSFRMIGTFHETVTQHLFTTLERVLQPSWLLVIGDFFPRGNVDTTVVMESASPRPKGADLLFDSVYPRARSFEGSNQ